MMQLPGMSSEPIEADEEDGELLPRQERFVAEYVKDFNAARSARDAGYSAVAAAAIGCELLKRPKIRKAVRLAKAAFAERCASEPVTKEWVIARLMSIAQANMNDVAEWGPDLTERARKDGKIEVTNGVRLVPSVELPASVTYAVTEISQTKDGVKFKLADKRAALADIAKILGLVTENVNHTGKVETVVSNGPDVSKMTVDQLRAWEAFLIASAEAETVKDAHTQP